MDVQLFINFSQVRIPSNLTLENRRVYEMKSILRRYYGTLVFRDVNDYALYVAPFKEIKDLFQIGHLATLRYISIPRKEVNPSPEWVDGFIRAAERLALTYKGYEFQE